MRFCYRFDLSNGNTSYIDAIFLLGEICLKQGKIGEARSLYQRALESGRFSTEESGVLESRIAALPR